LRSPPAARGHATLAIAAAFLCCGCRADQRVLRLSHEAELTSLDPIAASDHIAVSVLSNLYDTLVDFDGEMRLTPALAVSWSTPDERTWVFVLRTGVATHDGGRLTPENVRRSLERARLDPRSSLRERLTGVESVDVTAAGQLRVRTKESDPLLAHRLTGIFIAAGGPDARLEERPVGTGPYRFVGRLPGGLEAEAFPGCWRGAPVVPRVRFVHLAQGQETVAALAGGAVDVLRFVPEDQVTRVSELPGFRIARHSSPRALYLWMRAIPDAGGPTPFSDARVRRGVSRAIDRQALAAQMGGFDEPLEQMVPRGIYGHVPGAALPFDPVASRRLIAEAGYPGGFETPLSYVPALASLAERLAEALAAVGIRVRKEPLEWPELRERWQAGQLTFFVGSWSFASAEASFFFRECLWSRDPGGRNPWNPGFASPRLDALIEENDRLFHADDRQRHFARLAEALAEEMPVVPLLGRTDLYAVSERVRWKPRFDGSLRAAEMSLSDR
jgi:peptide/nickel transport system substrate-binding protein